MDELRKNITVRHVTPADFAAVAQVFSGEKVLRGTFQLPFPSPELWRQRLSEPEPGLIQLVACREAEVVGILGLHTNPNLPRRRHAARIGMAVRDDCQGRGIGSALLAAAVDLADNWLNIVRLELDVYIDNEPAVRLYQKFGFEIEGTLRQFAFLGGVFVDAYQMSRLRPAAAASRT
ncbi:MAG: GNAT family N-acetyltransferase [Pedosphaera sp.]|nr:GNAT family N-acetyltransferase [Pedosphaera sp.]